MNRSASYYLLLLFAPAFYIFYVLVTWVDCKDVSKFDARKYVLEAANIPDDATCFTMNHGNVVFHSYNSLEDNQLFFVSLILILIVLLCLLYRPSKRFLSAIRMGKR